MPPRQHPVPLEAAERLLALDPKGYRALLFSLQGAERPIALAPLVRQILKHASQMAAVKPLPRPPALEPPEELPLFSGQPEAPERALVRTTPAEVPSRWAYSVVGSEAPWLLPQSWVDEWAKDFGAEFVEGCLLAAKTWTNAEPSRRKTARGMRRFLASWITRQWDCGAGRRTAGGGSAGGIRSAPSPLGKSNATMARMVAEAQEMPF